MAKESSANKNNSKEDNSKEVNNNNNNNINNNEDGRGGIRFGSDSANAYAGEVGYDMTMSGGPTEYNQEIVDDDEDDDDVVESVDTGRMSASHPSTLARQRVRFSIQTSTSSWVVGFVILLLYRSKLLCVVQIKQI